VKNIEKILVRSTNWIGDAIMATPAIRRLRELFPLAHITVAARPWVLPIFSENPYIDSLMPVPKCQGVSQLFSIWNFSRKLNKAHFDLGLLLPNSFASALSVHMAGITYRTGYATDMRSVLLTMPVPVPAWKGSRHEVFYYLNLIDRLANSSSPHGQETAWQQYQGTGQPELTLKVNTEARRWAGEFLRDRGVSEDHIVIGLNPGAAFGPAKCWPVENFRTLTRMLLNEPGLSQRHVRIVVLGTKKEKKVGNAICATFGQRAINAAGQTDLSQAIALIDHMDLLVTNDSGLMHVGAALDRPLVALFGSTNPVTTGPWSSRSMVVQNPMECAPCLRRKCPSDFRCMKGLEPGQVFETCMEQLKAHVL